MVNVLFINWPPAGVGIPGLRVAHWTEAFVLQVGLSFQR